MTYRQCIEYFYQRLPMFQRSGPAALKTDLDNIILLCRQLHDPQDKFPTVHVGGTNGKGSSSHLLAAVLQTSGYKTGLYTSPHIKDFRERIKINGKLISKSEVVAFVKRHKRLLDKVKPSFFELTVAMAFDHFSKHQVDIAIIEVGLGGRLDSTNIISPLVALITNIGIDHSNILGNTLTSIAREKAGIIKANTPVVIGEHQVQTDHVFVEIAKDRGCQLIFAMDQYKVTFEGHQLKIRESATKKSWLTTLQLKGPYQIKNIPGVLEVLNQLVRSGYQIAKVDIIKGFEKVIDLTGIKGRWQKLSENPVVICDTAHNRAAMQYIVRELQSLTVKQLRLVLGFVNDKDITSMLEILPKDAYYYFCAATVPRSLDAGALYQLASGMQLSGRVVVNPNEALAEARKDSHPDDFIFVGGSTFVVAELKEL